MSAWNTFVRRRDLSEGPLGPVDPVAPTGPVGPVLPAGRKQIVSCMVPYGSGATYPKARLVQSFP